MLLMKTHCPPMKVRLLNRWRPVTGRRETDKLICRTVIEEDGLVRWVFDLVFPQTPVDYNADDEELVLPDGTLIVPDRIVASCTAHGDIIPGQVGCEIVYDREAVIDADGWLGGNMLVKPTLGHGEARLPDGRVCDVESKLEECIGRPDGWFGWKSYTVEETDFESTLTVRELHP